MEFCQILRDGSRSVWGRTLKPLYIGPLRKGCTHKEVPCGPVHNPWPGGELPYPPCLGLLSLCKLCNHPQRLQFFPIASINNATT